MTARRALFEGLIDDAGLFPPARLPMVDALAAHAVHRQGPWSWVLGRFLCPASRLEELLESLPDELAPLRIGIIADSGVVVDDDRLIVETFEARVDRDTEPPLGATVYLEAVDSTDRGLVEAIVDEAADRGVGAKLRCGGEDAALYPTPDAVAAFLVRAVDRGVGCKATAGLHHAVRRGIEHGFLNLLAAACLLTAKAIEGDEVEAVISDDDPRSFALDETAFRWQDRAADADAVAAARDRTFHAYGSCSFTEPIDDLLALGML